MVRSTKITQLVSFKWAYFLILVFFSFTAKSVVWTATACPATWGASPYPFWNGATQLTSANLANGDVLDVPAGCTVNISSGVNITKDITIQLGGCLNFTNPGASLDLTASSMIVATTGCIDGVSSSNQIKIGGGPAEYKGPDPITGPFIMTNGFLPIELIAFTGDFEQKVVYLQWKSLTETNNNYYEIEKSTDGINFVKIATIKSLAPGGTSAVPLEYKYIDKDMQDPIYYYRLRQVDLDGSSKRTNAISVKIYTAEFSIYPNPNSGNFSINVPSVKLHEELSIRIYNPMGKLVHESIEYVKNNNVTGSTVDVIPSQNLANGIYMANITFKGETFKLKLIVQ